LQSGWAVGLIGTIIIGIICTHCVHILIQAEYELCKRKKVPLMNYAAVAENSLSEGPSWLKPFGAIFSEIINVFLVVYLIGASCVYVLFVASNIKALVDYAFDIDLELRIYMWIILLPLIMINLIKKLKFYAPFSTVGNAITMVSFAIIAYYIFREPITFEGKHAVGSLSEFPLFFGTVLFALEAIYVVSLNV
jgi:proton-coupled amino acid transporter